MNLESIHRQNLIERYKSSYVESASLYLLAKKGRVKLAHCTYLVFVNNNYGVKYHNTDVVIYNPNSTFTLNSGGYRTQTTKRRINKYSPAVVVQQKGIWYLCDPTNTEAKFEFYDNVIVDVTGVPI